MENGIVVNLPIGRAAAILTVFEYILGVFAALAARASLRGLWLLKLHRNGKASVSSNARARRGLIREVVTTVLSIWLVTAIALMESGLENTVHISENSQVSPHCMRIDRPLKPSIVDSLIPPMKVTIEPWALLVAKKFRCNTAIHKKDKGKQMRSISDNAALETLGMSENTNIDNAAKKDIYAPTCRQNASISPHLVTANITKLTVHSKRLTMKASTSQAAEIYPYCNEGIIRAESPNSLSDYTEASEGPCVSKNLSAFPTTVYSRWRSVYAPSSRVMEAVHNLICSNHSLNVGQGEGRAMVAGEVLQCIDLRTRTLQPQCLRNVAIRLSSSQTNETKLLHSVLLSNVSVAIFAQYRNNASFACVDSTVAIEYVLLNPDILTLVRSTSTPKYRVIVPTMYRITNGHCERTVSVLGRAALVYSADAEWQISDLARLDRVTRYRAFMIAVSSSLFPLGQVDAQLEDENKTCKVHSVRYVTLVQKGWRLVFLSIAVLVSILLVFTALVFRWMFRGRSWVVGSAKWSLSRFAIDNLANWPESDEKKDDEVDIEVIVEEQEREKNDHEAHTNLEMNSEVRIGGDLESSTERPFPILKSSQEQKSLSDEQYRYRMRTVIAQK